MKKPISRQNYCRIDFDLNKYRKNLNKKNNNSRKSKPNPKEKCPKRKSMNLRI